MSLIWKEHLDYLETNLEKKAFAFLFQQATPATARWDETPGHPKGSETPGATPSARLWDATPGHATPGHATPGRETPATGTSRRNRWDETPKTERGLFFCRVKAHFFFLSVD